MKKSAGFPFRCMSCRRGWGLLRIDEKLIRCAVCGYQNTTEEAERTAREQAARP